MRYLFLVIPASLRVLILVLISHGEPRFIFFPLAPSGVAGAMSVESRVTQRGGRLAVPVAWGPGRPGRRIVSTPGSSKPRSTRLSVGSPVRTDHRAI